MGFALKRHRLFPAERGIMQGEEVFGKFVIYEQGLGMLALDGLLFGVPAESTESPG